MESLLGIEMRKRQKKKNQVTFSFPHPERATVNSLVIVVIFFYIAESYKL